MCFFSRDVITGVRKGVGKNIKLDETLSHLGFFLNLWYRMKTMIVPNNLSRGVIKCEIHIFAPPPSWFIFFPKDIYYNEVVRAAGEKLCISPLFFIPFQSFFSPKHDIWPYFLVKQKNIHPWTETGWVQA